MKDREIKEMLSRIIEQVDYDIWKQMFEPDCIEDPDETEVTIRGLVDLVREYQPFDA